MRYGLREYEVKDIIQRELDRNPDLKYYINDPYFDEFISLLVAGISRAIIINNEKVVNDIEQEIRSKVSVWR